MFDLRRLGKVDHLSMVGTNGSKYPAIRKHLDENIGQVYKDMDTSYVDSNVCFNLIILIFFTSIDSWPTPRKEKPIQKLVRAVVIYFTSLRLMSGVDKAAINALKPGDAVIVFTPDSKGTLFSSF